MNRYIVLDFETYPVDGKSYIMEIGCVEVIDGVIGQSFHTMVRPVTEVSPFVLNLTGISEADLAEAPLFTDVMGGFYNFIQNSVIVAHNANLDCLSYESFCRYLNIEIKSFLWVDSQDIIKLLDPTIQTLQLQGLLNVYDLQSSVSHRAKEDAIGLAQLLIYYSHHRSLILTREEAQFLKKSHLVSIRLMIKFLLTHFSVELSDEVLVTDAPLFNSLHSDLHSEQDNIIYHYGSLDELLSIVKQRSQCCLLVSAQRINENFPYIASPSMYVFPDKISRLYPLLTDVRLSHIEMIELYGIINWLRHTDSFLLSDLNDQLIQRYNHMVKGVLDTHPLAMLNFVRSKLSNAFEFGRFTECHYEMLVLIFQHLPSLLKDLSIVIYNFIHFNRQLSELNERRISFASFKSLTKLILNLAYIIDYLTYLGKDNLKFVQDFARLKSLIHLINEERFRMFQKIDFVVEALSINIYDYEKRQILINENVFQTVEWQEALSSMTTIVRYFEETLKLFQKISYYIYSDLNGWFSDLIYTFNVFKNDLAMFLTLPDNGVLYIESQIKHKPSNCTIVIKNLYEHDFYSQLCNYASRIFIHQPMFQGGYKQCLTQFLGHTPLKMVSNSLDTLKANIVFKTQNDIREFVGQASTEFDLYIVLSSKKRIRFWRQKLRSFVLSSQVNSGKKISFKRYDELSHQYSGEYKVVFPEFFLPNTFQPIHQVRLSDDALSEHDYINYVFYEELHVVLDYFPDIDQSSLVLNVDQRLKPILLFS